MRTRQGRWIRLLIGMLAVLVAATGLPGRAGVSAQGDADGWTYSRLNMRAGPGTSYPAVVVLEPETGLIFEARTADLGWLLGRTLDGTHRGWIASGYVTYRDGFVGANLPLSDEIVPASDGAPAGDGAPAAATDSAEEPAPDAASEPPVAPDSNGAPAAVSGPVPTGVRAIFQRGQQLGNRPNAFIKVGDSVTIEQGFFAGFGSGVYDLGPYTDWQTTIAFFQQTGSFGHIGEAAMSGYSSQSVLDSTWSNPNKCAAGESPLDCEVRRHRPAVAIVYFGGNDMLLFPPAEFATHIDQITARLAQLGVIPVLTTFAIAPDGHPDAYNTYSDAVPYLQAIRATGARYGVPVIEFQQAAAALPDGGVLSDGYHLTFREDRLISFSGDEAVFGTTLREFLTLRTLHDLRRQVLQGG